MTTAPPSRPSRTTTIPSFPAWLAQRGFQTPMMLSQASAQALARLRAYKPPPTHYNKLPLTRRAAVLILLFPDCHGDLKVVLTMRAATLRSYASQAALPGGKADTPTETPFTTARREAWEEIGLPTTDSRLPPGFRVEHLCELPLNLAKTELGVRPCVAYLCPSGDADVAGADVDVEEKMIPRLDPKEVAAVFVAPFAQFLRTEWTSEGPAPRNSKGGRHSWYRGSWTDWHESRWRMHNFYVPRPLPSSPSSSSSRPTKPANHEADDTLPETSTFRVFGMTARILVDAARVAYGQEPEFEHNAHFGDEEIIGRLLGMGRLSAERRHGDELTGEVVRAAAASKI